MPRRTCAQLRSRDRFSLSIRGADVCAELAPCRGLRAPQEGEELLLAALCEYSGTLWRVEDFAELRGPRSYKSLIEMATNHQLPGSVAVADRLRGSAYAQADGCSGAATWREAEALCAAAGARLCTAGEAGEAREAALRVRRGCRSLAAAWTADACSGPHGGQGRMSVPLRGQGGALCVPPTVRNTLQALNLSDTRDGVQLLPIVTMCCANEDDV